jgi:hypothetical protein
MPESLTRRSSLALLAAGAAAAATRVPAAEDIRPRFFSPRSPWNTPIPPDPSLAPASEAIGSLLATSGFRFQLNRDRWTVNVAFAPPGTPRRTVSGPQEPQGVWRMDGVPIPPGATGTSDDDGALCIVDEERNLVWNLNQARRSGDTLRAFGMGVFRADGPGWWDPDGGPGGPWTGRSSNASYLAGLVFPEELSAGTIPHALAVGLDHQVLTSTAVAPALTSDETNTGTLVPNGTRLQLDPGLDLSGFPMGREAKVIARALQTYGAFVVEATDGFALYFRSAENLGRNPYAAMAMELPPGLHRHWRVIAPEAPYEYDHAGRFGQPHR